MTKQETFFAKWLIAVFLILVVGLVGRTIIVDAAHATENPTFTKYDTTFVYQGDNTWAVTPNHQNQALHNIGNKQSWLCNSNNVGPGIEPCVVGKIYITNGDLIGDRSCVYIQGDSPAWDTVPNTEKEVCAPIKPQPTQSPTPSTSPSPSSSPSTSPTSTPQPTPTSSQEPSPQPSTTASLSSSPSPTETPSLVVTTPAPSETQVPVSEMTELPATGLDAFWTRILVSAAVSMVTTGIVLYIIHLVRRKRSA